MRLPDIEHQSESITARLRPRRPHPPRQHVTAALGALQLRLIRPFSYVVGIRFQGEEDSLRQDLSYHNRNQEEWDTLAQNEMEMKKAADELYQLPETDTESSAQSEENEE
ncbi:hypothetical protein EVAR_43192_1 [Eumeta japonica]|uniref:Uncharacterized protein n=1 Tax=Eumeta variegata TaxID=151549 RepID=A0A4C1WVM6_EUMVA|nr:hypothetical protein EVAR_43192_1 [Eumeta japonica]